MLVEKLACFFHLLVDFIGSSTISPLFPTLMRSANWKGLTASGWNSLAPKLNDLFAVEYSITLETHLKSRRQIVLFKQLIGFNIKPLKKTTTCSGR